MLSITDTAKEQLDKILTGKDATGKHLIIFFQGYG